jgi:hypothetical protein
MAINVNLDNNAVNDLNPNSVNSSLNNNKPQGSNEAPAPPQGIPAIAKKPTKKTASVGRSKR